MHEPRQALRRDQVRATPYYCEENVYLACAALDPCTRAR
jgi:hypothetical protein